MPQVAVKKTLEIKTSGPRQYSVVLLNDDYTPMEFVVGILMSVFSWDLERATQVMKQVHYQGRAVCGMFAREIAEMKVHEINSAGRLAGYPLLSVIESVGG